MSPVLLLPSGGRVFWDPRPSWQVDHRRSCHRFHCVALWTFSWEKLKTASVVGVTVFGLGLCWCDRTINKKFSVVTAPPVFTVGLNIRVKPMKVASWRLDTNWWGQQSSGPEQSTSVCFSRSSEIFNCRWNYLTLSLFNTCYRTLAA